MTAPTNAVPMDDPLNSSLPGVALPLPEPGTPRSPAWWVLLATVSYLVFALVSLYLSAQTGSIATLWYANAVAVCVLLARPMREWPALLAGVVAANLGANLLFRDNLMLMLSFVPGNLAEISLSAGLLGRFCVPPQCINRADMLLKALLLGGVVPSLVGALLGAGTLAAYGLAPFEKVWFSWFVGSAIGSVSILPLGLFLLARGWPPLVAALRRPAVLASLLMALAISLWAPRALPFAYVYIAVALVLVAAVGRFAGAAMATLACSLVVGTLIATGIFQPQGATGQISEGLFYLPLMLTLVPPMLLAATLENVQSSVEQIAEREAHFRALYQNTPAMMHSADASGKLVSVNKAWLDHMGYQSHEVLGRSPAVFLTPESQRHFVEVVDPQFQRDGFLKNAQYQVVTKRGDIIDVMLSAIWETDASGQRLYTLAVVTDVSEQKRLAAELTAKQELIQVTLHSIGDGVVTTDARGRISYLNPIAEAMVGQSLAEARGQPFAEVVHLFDPSSALPLLDPVERCLRQQLKQGLPASANLRDRNGREYGVQDSVAPILGRDGSLLGAVMVFQDVTEARSLAQKMSYLAHHDGLTDLPNRVLFQDRLHQACQFSLRHRDRLAVIFMDLDHFKNVNDSLGHAIGDQLLKTVARRLTDTLRASDTVCRLGGDEFVMLLANLRHPDDAREVADKILRDVALPCLLDGTEVNVSVSMGIAMFPEDGQDPDTLMKHADTAMYRSKREGRNRYHFFARTVDDAALARLQLESDIRRGLAEGQFQVHYQPILDSRTRRVVAVEALARWVRDGHHTAYPALFIPVAEETGLIVPLGQCVLQQACEQLQAWSGTVHAEVSMAVNVSMVQLAHPGFAQLVAKVLHSTGVAGQRLELEITESTLMKDPEATLQVLQQLKTLGVRIAIDDFGTGYSSLSHLKRFPVDTVKIDRSFVRDMEIDAGDRELVKAILAMSKSLRLHAVAEGVETEAQATILAAMDCPGLQGYLFAAPADARATSAWLDAHFKD